MQRWYVVQTKPRFETIARLNLTDEKRRGGPFIVFLPEYTKTRRHAGKTEEVSRPLFERYLFVQVDLDSAHRRWQDINATRGVSRMVTGAGDRPLPLPEGYVESLQARAESDGGKIKLQGPEVPVFRRGQVVRMTEGPFVGYSAAVLWDTTSDQERVFLLFRVLGGETKLSLPLGGVVAA